MRPTDELFDALARSEFRSRFKLGPADRRYLADRGLEAVLGHARRFVVERLAPADPPNDGKQTPWRGHPVFVAQHATATCCRGCLAKWHGIAAGRPLTDPEVEHVVGAIGRWLRERQARGSAPPTVPSLFDGLDDGVIR